MKRNFASGANDLIRSERPHLQSRTRGRLVS
jgi:hypothetical protein